MLKLIKELFSLLTPEQLKRFYILQILVVLMAFAEVLGVASIIPFMALVGDMSQLTQDTIIAEAFQASGIDSELQFVFLLGVGVLTMFFISATISIFTTWRLSMFANKVGTEIADKLYTYYLQQDWLFHTNVSSAQLTKKIANETLRVTNAILTPLMQINARIAIVLFISLTVFIYDPGVAVIGLVAYGIAYFILYKVVRMRLLHNGKSISELTEIRFRLMNEGFGGIKDILLLGRDDNFINKFNHAGRSIAYSQGTNATLAAVPRYFVELFAFGSMIALVLYLIVNHDGDLGMILPIISVYALATFKLLPAFQLIYASAAQIRGNIAAFESIQQDLSDAIRVKSERLDQENSSLKLKQQISLKNITFTYPEKSNAALKTVNIVIPVNNVVGIVGKSGSGKSTIIDIILGLIQPQEGELNIDTTIINNHNRRQWQNIIGFVPQNIFLSEGTIAENVAFGIPHNQIDTKNVQQALELSQLNDLVEGLEYGIETKIGERGVKLSGGQRQRIGIARALYHQADVLVFDEATSSLDGISEKKIMEAIYNLSGQKTIIIIAHRLKTVQKCDKIFFMDNGQVTDQGTYQELIEMNKNFRDMAEHA